MPDGVNPSIPDPTVLTTAQLDRAVSAERDYVDGQLQVLETRLAGIDEATKLHLRGIVDIPERIDEKVGHLAEVTTERFNSIQRQFTERDTRSIRESSDNKIAVDAAFAAQKEAASEQNKANTKAIDKSEESTAEAINKLGELSQTTTKALESKVDDIKERVVNTEGGSRGASDEASMALATRAQLTASRAITAAIVGPIIAVVIGALVAYVASH